MNYIHISTRKYPVTLSEIKNENQSCIFPGNPTKEDLLPFGYAPVNPTASPFSDFWKDVKEIAPILDENGDWIQQWEVVQINRTQEEIDGYLSDLRQQVLRKIQDQKNLIRDSGFLVDIDGQGTMIRFDSDYAARTAYAELAMMFMQDPTIVLRWKASDNPDGSSNWVDMSAPMFGAVFVAGRSHLQNCFNWQELKEQEILAASTDEAILAISTVYQE